MWRLSPRFSRTALVAGHYLEGVQQRCFLSTSAVKFDVSNKPAETGTTLEGASAAPPAPPPPPPPRKSGILWKLIGLSIVGAGGVVGYAWYDSNFRHILEDRVPYSKEALGYVFHYLPVSPDSGQQVVPVKKGEPLPSLIKRDQAEGGLQPAEQSSLLSSELEKLEGEEKKRREKEKIDLAVKIREAEEAAENAELEGRLSKLLGDSVRSVELASGSLLSAASAVKENTKEVRRQMEASGTESEWYMTDARTVQSDDIWKADVAAEKAKSELDRLRTALSVGKSKPSTQRNRMLLSAEEELNRLSYSLDTSIAQLSKAQSEAKIVSEYRYLVRKGREQFRKELESVVPDVKIGQRLGEGQLTEDELNSLIAHAHRRIEQLQKQLSEQQTAEQQRLNVALERQKEEDEMLAAERVGREKERMQAELNITKQRWEEESRVQFERDLRTQLSRQAAAHSDHLTEVLRLQQEELKAAFDIRLNACLDQEKVSFQRLVAGWIARMRGIDKALADRADFDKEARRAQELWLACQTLQTLIAEGKVDGDTWEDRLKPLKPELEAIVSAAPENGKLVSAVVDTVPETAVSRGVWTEAALVERFARVRTIARRVAFIDETGGTLFRYFLSYFMSPFVMRHSSRGDDREIAVDDLTPFVLLDRAASSLDRGDLEQAVRYINQLTGEPRKVASDWLCEARLLLETRQAADALVAYAVAAGLESVV